MKLRPVLLVLLILSGFYYVTTHSSATGERSLAASRRAPRLPTRPLPPLVTGPTRQLPAHRGRRRARLRYRRAAEHRRLQKGPALRRQHHLHRRRLRLLLRPGPAAGPGLRLHPRPNRASSSPTITSSTTRSASKSRSPTSTSTRPRVVGVDQGPRSRSPQDRRANNLQSGHALRIHAASSSASASTPSAIPSASTAP